MTTSSEKNAQHTPGTWRVAQFTKTDVLHPIYNDVIASCFQPASSEYYAKGEPEANARLIAAAPDLLSALQDVIGFIPACYNEAGEHPVYAKARSAIAKATGKQA